MSAVTQASRGPTDDSRTDARGSSRLRGRTRHRLALVVAVVVLAWSVVELANLMFNHTTGPELYGVLVAALSVAGAVLSVLLLRSEERRLRYALPLIGLWALVALGGIAGAVAHIVGPVAGHGPVDLRPRPVAAPLIFTVLSLVGGAALWLGQRPAATQARNVEEE